MEETLRLDPTLNDEFKTLQRELSEYTLEKEVLLRFARYITELKARKSYRHVNDRNKDFSFAAQTLVFYFKHAFKSTGEKLERTLEIVDFTFTNHDYQKEIQKKRQELKIKQGVLKKAKEDSKADLEREIQTIRDDITSLEEESAFILSNPFREKCIQNSLGQRNHILAFIKQSRDEQLTNKFLLALKFFPELIKPKIEPLHYQKKLDNGYTLEILTGEGLNEIVTLGVTNRCCLNLPASGTKYFFNGLFKENSSFFVVRDPNGKIIASSLIEINENIPYSFHVDFSPSFIREPYTKERRQLLASLIYIFLEDIKKTTGHEPLIFFGEATLQNLGIFNTEELQELNERIKQILIKNKFPIEEIEASISSGRTDVRLYPFFAYTLENLNILPILAREEILQVLKETIGDEILINTQTTNTNDIFRISENDGHGISQLYVPFSTLFRLKVQKEEETVPTIIAEIPHKKTEEVLPRVIAEVPHKKAERFPLAFPTPLHLRPLTPPSQQEKASEVIPSFDLASFEELKKPIATCEVSEIPNPPCETCTAPQPQEEREKESTLLPSIPVKKVVPHSPQTERTARDLLKLSDKGSEKQVSLK